MTRSAETEAGPALEAVLLEKMEVLDRAGLRRALSPLHGRHGATIFDGERVLVDFASNDYLGLAADPRVAEAAAEFLRTEGTGAAAARLISGHHTVHAALEATLARFLGTEAALLFPSGYMANLGAIPALVGAGDAIFADERNHASLIDGCRLSRADVHTVPHADLATLDRLLGETAGRFRRRLIVVEGIYSMDGDLCPLGGLPTLARRHGAWTYVDDAHGLGALGPGGRGAVELAGVTGEIDVWVGTLGKAFGAAGAFVAGTRTLIDFLCNRARTFVYTTGSPPAIAAAALKAIEIATAEPELRDRLHVNARRVRAGLGALGWPPNGPSDGHIIPVVLGPSEETMAIGAGLRAAGFLVGAVRPPTVPRGTARLRITASAAHEEGQIDALLATLRTLLPPRP